MLFVLVCSLFEWIASRRVDRFLAESQLCPKDCHAGFSDWHSLWSHAKSLGPECAIHSTQLADNNYIVDCSCIFLLIEQIGALKIFPVIFMIFLSCSCTIGRLFLEIPDRVRL